MYFELEIGFNGVLDIDNTNIAIKNKRRTLEGLRVDFSKITNLSIYLENGYVRGFKASETRIWPKNPPVIYQVSVGLFFRINKFLPLTLKSGMSGLKTSGTRI